MDVNVFVGLAVCVIALLWGFPPFHTDTMTYLDKNSAIVVLGCLFGATIICTNPKELKSMALVFWQLIRKPKKLEPRQAVDILVHVAGVAQRGSYQALVEEVKGKDDGFLERAFGMVAAGLDREFIQRTMETDISEIQRRHGTTAANIRTMGTFAPMFGMLGTVLGVTQVLQNVTDINTIVSGMSLAMITTMDGLILSGIFFIPISNKLKSISAREILVKQIIMEGVLAIIDKEIPLKVEKYLEAFLASKEKLKKVSGGK